MHLSLVFRNPHERTWFAGPEALLVSAKSKNCRRGYQALHIFRLSAKFDLYVDVWERALLSERLVGKEKKRACFLCKSLKNWWDFAILRKNKTKPESSALTCMCVRAIMLVLELPVMAKGHAVNRFLYCSWYSDRTLRRRPALRRVSCSVNSNTWRVRCGQNSVRAEEMRALAE